MHHILAWILFLSLTTTLSHATSAPSSKQPESPFDTIGLRLGGDVNADVSLTSYELFVTSEPQWSCELSEKVNAGIGYEAAIGALAGEGEVAADLHFGFSLKFAHQSIPVSVIITTGPSLYSEDSFGDFDIGGHIHFTSSFGLNWKMCESWALEYRIQHTSNAGLEDNNPGLDMHAVALTRSF